MRERCDAEFRPKRVIEVGHIAKAAVERDVDDARLVRRETDCGLSQAHALQIPVRRQTRDPRERADEVNGLKPASRASTRSASGAAGSRSMS